MLSEAEKRGWNGSTPSFLPPKCVPLKRLPLSVMAVLFAPTECALQCITEELTAEGAWGWNRSTPSVVVLQAGVGWQLVTGDDAKKLRNFRAAV